MRRNHLSTVVLLIIVITAGCSISSKTPTSKPLPERPETLNNGTVKDYAKNMESSYIWNEYRGEYDQVSIGTMNITILNSTDDEYIVHIEYTVGLEDFGSTGDKKITANYLINGSVTKRSQTNGHVSPGPDPRNGTLISKNS